MSNIPRRWRRGCRCRRRRLCRNCGINPPDNARESNFDLAVNRPRTQLHPFSGTKGRADLAACPVCAHGMFLEIGPPMMTAAPRGAASEKGRCGTRPSRPIVGQRVAIRWISAWHAAPFQESSRRQRDAPFGEVPPARSRRPGHGRRAFFLPPGSPQLAEENFAKNLARASREREALAPHPPWISPRDA